MATLMLPSASIAGSLSSLKGDTWQSCTGSTRDKTRVVWQRRSSKRTKQAVRISAETSDAIEGEAGPPKIHIKFLSHKTEESPRNVSVGSGEKQLRKLMLEEKVPLYDAFGTVMNCGGAGNCATCLVERPESWRLACQTILGDKTNAGEVVIQCLPQKVKK